MDKKYLHKVLDQIVSETRIDHDEVDYVWEEYKRIIINKIKNNG